MVLRFNSFLLDVHKSCGNTFRNTGSVSLSHSTDVRLLTPTSQIPALFCKLWTLPPPLPLRFSICSLCIRFIFRTNYATHLTCSCLCVLNLSMSTWGAEKASRAFFGPFGRPQTRRVRGRHRQPVRPAEHRDDRHRQHGAERRQRAGHQGLWHGLHPDRCHHQCEHKHKKHESAEYLRDFH